MKKSEYQKFQTFKKRHNLTEIFIAKVMNEYALTDDKYSASYFMDKYKVSEHVFYKMRDYAVIFMLISPFCCKLIREKSVRNQISNNPSGNFNTSNKYYVQLIAKRRRYLLSFSNDVIREVAVMYSDGYTIYEIAEKFNISTEVVRRLIAAALMRRLVSEDMYQRIKFRSDLLFLKLRNRNLITAEQLWNWYF